MLALSPRHYAVVALDGDLDAVTNPEIAERLAFVARARFGIVDLSAATFIDAAFLSILHRVRRENARDDAAMILVVADPHIEKILHLVGFHGTFQIVRTLDEGMVRVAEALRDSHGFSKLA